MVISLQGPAMSGKSIRSRQLQEYFEGRNYRVAIVEESPVNNRLRYERMIRPILEGDEKGVVITNGLEIDRSNGVIISPFSGFTRPDLILRTRRDNDPEQFIVTEKTALQDILRFLPLTEN